MNILFIGDIIGSPARKKICSQLPDIIEKENIFFTIAQGENLAGGIGITEKTAKELFKAGVDCITTGNHVWKHKEVYKYLDEETRLLRPANYPEGVPGIGYFVYEKENCKIGVINLEGRAFMKPLQDPFSIGKKIAESMYKETKNILVDFHAEATGEKRALSLYLSEYTTAFIGTHTHVQTADERIINSKTAYISDVGMVGSMDSVIGVKKEEIIKHLLLSLPQRFKVAKENILANCVIIDFDEKTGRAYSIIRYNF
ncbi:TIGR00282 family metallophosphoesterase [candidate division WOR-3 bacterium]|nr:TIGR00282 family metallophosphoesterase [candidate division WOR-3 bacterium]